jgi:hypothetical protein
VISISAECTCLTCGKKFIVIPSRANAKYCSYECYNKNKLNKQIIKTCPVCGKEFKVIPANLKKGNGKYCSKICMGMAHKGKHKSNYKGGITCICKQCGKHFQKQPNQVKKGHGKFCSKKCYGESIQGINNKFYKQGKIKRICKTCGKEFTVAFSVVKRGNGVYCSRACQVGEGTPMWKGGLSYYPYCPKFNEQLKERVRTFFGRKCVLCHKTEKELGRKLDVHHVDYEKDNCCNDTRDPLFVPLCLSCHMKTNRDRYDWEIFFRYYLTLGYNNRCF